MKYLIALICAFIQMSCQPNKDLPEGIRDKYRKVSRTADECHDLLNKYKEERCTSDFLLIKDKLTELTFDYANVELNDEQYKICRTKKLLLDSLKREIKQVLSSDINLHELPLIEISEKLIEHSFTQPFYVQRGATVHVNTSSDKKYIVKIYNADSKDLLYNSGLVDHTNHTLSVSNSAIFLIEITCVQPSYLDINLKSKIKKLEDLYLMKRIKTDTISCQKNDFKAHIANGIQMKSLFQEPRKITLRSQGKAIFSGSFRSIVALNLPANSSDIMYRLRISTSDSDKSSDGDFFDKTYKRYHKIRFLGLPVYESSRNGSSLLRDLLSISKPPREEEAYCSMYVFKTAADARKFQNEANISTLKYNLDYSIVGTQSCNGRIPSFGLRTIYLGFENEKMTSSIYIWLEAISTTNKTEYYKERYKLIQ